MNKIQMTIQKKKEEEEKRNNNQLSQIASNFKRDKYYINLDNQLF